jgi:predicted alpha/beta-fold hydrolase
LYRTLDNDNVAIAITQTGGHIGFPEGWWPVGSSYADNVMAEFIQAVLATPKS